jgi:hypothetical protein
MSTITARQIIDGLIAISDARIWASELAFFGGVSRIDFWTLEPTASQKFRATAYEVKISRSDFARDTESKQSDALRYSDRFWYVTPPGLLKRDEIPEWAGLMEFDGEAFAVRKRAPMREKAEPDWWFVVNLMRACGDSRRDVTILKQQLSSYKSAYERSEEQRRISSNMQFRRFMDRQRALAS